MTSAIGFLEQAGRSGLTPAQYAAGVSLLEIDEKQRQALLDRDAAALNELLGGRRRLLFAILAPDDEVEQD
jgi:hypothetical protein